MSKNQNRRKKGRRKEKKGRASNQITSNLCKLQQFIHTLPTTPESNNQSTGIRNSLYREIAMSLVRKSAYTLCSALGKNGKPYKINYQKKVAF